VVLGAAAFARCDAGEIMAGAAHESKRRVPAFSPKAEQQADNREAPPEQEGVECRKPERGLT